MLHTLRFADEVLPADEHPFEAPERGPSSREVEMARRLLEGMHEAFDPDARTDEHREQVLALIERKAKGEDVDLPAAEDEPEPDDDLLGALEASLAGAKGGSR